ncbi:cytochrome P450 [Streptomyces sp. M19]
MGPGGRRRAGCGTSWRCCARRWTRRSRCAAPPPARADPDLVRPAAGVAMSQRHRVASRTPAARRLLLATAVSLTATLPRWLPPAVVALRERIFTRVNGDEGIEVPGRDVPVEDFKRVYGHPAANGRSEGAALSDLFWYWLAPGPEVHQEHLEPGSRYDEVARTTRQILARLSREEWALLVGRCTRRALDRLGPGPVRRTRLRDLMMPVWAEVYYELVFREPCPPEARRLVVRNAEDVINALKCTSLRHMDRRAELTRYLMDRLARGPLNPPLPAGLTPREQAYYLQGTFFNTAVVQMSEGMAHLLLAIATHPGVQDRLLAGPDGTAADGDAYLDHVIDETLRVWPLFGVAHRVTTADIPARTARRCPGVGAAVQLRRLPARGARGRGPLRPRPLGGARRPAAAPLHPFGVTANRPCPARGFATLTMRVAAREVLRRYRLDSTAAHTRSLPSRGPCLLIAHRPYGDVGTYRARRSLMRVRDRWEGVPRSVTQLVLGSYMVWDARRQGLCRTYFARKAGTR